MGQQVAKHVFKPTLATYSGTDGEILYIRQRLDGQTEAATAPIIWLTTLRGNEIPAVLLKAQSEAPQFTMLLSHGNMEDLGIAMMQAQMYSDYLDCDVMLYDYTGYGIATGTPSEQNCYADIRAAYMYLVEDKRVNPDQIVLFGRSLGTGPTVWLASTEKVGAVILVNPFLSCVRVVQKVGFTPRFDMFPNVDRIHLVDSPVLVIHGRRDELVPFEHGKIIHKKARHAGEPLWIDEASHNDLEKAHGDRVCMHIQMFLAAVVESRTQPSLFARSTLNRDSTILSRGVGCLRPAEESCADGKASRRNSGLHSKTDRRGHPQKARSHVTTEFETTLESEAETSMHSEPKWKLAKQFSRLGHGRSNYEFESPEDDPSDLDEPPSFGKRALRTASSIGRSLSRTVSLSKGSDSPRISREFRRDSVVGDGPRKAPPTLAPRAQPSAVSFQPEDGADLTKTNVICSFVTEESSSCLNSDEPVTVEQDVSESAIVRSPDEEVEEIVEESIILMEVDDSWGQQSTSQHSVRSSGSKTVRTHTSSEAYSQRTRATDDDSMLRRKKSGKAKNVEEEARRNGEFGARYGSMQVSFAMLRPTRSLSIGGGGRISGDFEGNRMLSSRVDIANYNVISGLRGTSHLPDSDSAITVMLPATTLSQMKFLRQAATYRSKYEYSDTVLLRFLRGRKFNVGAALKTLLKYEALMRQLGVDPTVGPTLQGVGPILRTGMFCMPDSRDCDGHPLLFLRPALHNELETAWNDVVRAAVFVITELTEDEEVQRHGLSIVADLAGWSARGWRTERAKELVSALQGALPTRVRSVMVVDAPLWFLSSWLKIRPALSNRNARKWRLKIRRENIAKHVSKTDLPDFLGGYMPFDVEQWIQYRRSAIKPTYIYHSAPKC